MDAALLFQLGEELVNRRSVALAELIKNSYDADASKVTITFRNVSKVGGTIEVQDDGQGISLDCLRSKWLRIATRAKEEEPESARKRLRAGAKGVGRFAARRLAGKLVLESTAASDDRPGSMERVSATFDWGSFRPGLRLEDIEIPVERQFLSTAEQRKAKTGLRLILSEVRDAWSLADLEELQSDLLRLTAPSSNQSRDDFRIVLVAPDFPEFEGGLADRFLEYGLARLVGHLDKKGRPTYSLHFRDRAFGRNDPKPFRPDKRFPAAGSARFELSFFVYKTAFFAGLPIKTKEAQERGRSRGGVHIYVDRFRVPPYGDQGDDWLSLDEDRGRRVDAVPEELVSEVKTAPKRPMLLLPGNNQLFGSVYLSRRTNPQLRQTVNRERFIEDSAFRDLRAFVRLGIDWMTVQYAARAAAAKTRERSRTEALLESARAKFAAVVADSKLSEEGRIEVVQAFDLAMHAVEAREGELISELSMLRVLASTGTMIAVFEHQLMASMSGLEELAKRVRGLVRGIPREKREELEQEAVRLNGWVQDLQHQADMIGLLLAKDARARRKRVPIRDAVQSVADSFGSFMLTNAIKFENSVPAALKTPSIYPAELTAVLLNLITNALKAVRHTEQRSLRVDAERRDGSVVLSVCDTGVGADPESWEEFFLPFNSTSTPDPLLGHGTGLGLKIVRDIAQVYGGSARFVAPVSPWRTTLEVSIPES